MDSPKQTPLASVSDGNLMEKWTDWSKKYLTFMKKYKLDQSPEGRKDVDTVSRFGKVMCRIDQKIGLNAERKQAMVECMTAYGKVMDEMESKIDEMRKKGGGVGSGSGAVSNSTKEPEKSAEKALDNLEISGDEASNSTCSRCGFHCANYQKCPALGKQCRKCGRVDHYAKMCRYEPLASVDDGNLIEKWLDWKNSFVARVEEYELDETPAGKKVVKSVKSFGWEIVEADRKVGLKAERRKEVVDTVFKLEFDLTDAIAKLAKKIPDAYPKAREDYSDAVKPDDEEPCLQCGLHCKQYKRCPALGKQCRRCLRDDHYAMMCKSRLRDSECEYEYDEERVEKTEAPKRIHLEHSCHGNLVERWCDWEQSFMVRMRTYNFDSSTEGKKAVEKVSSFGKDVVEEDRKVGLRHWRKEELVGMIYKMENNLVENIARVADPDATAKENLVVNDEEKKQADHSMCSFCGYSCGNYKRCPARGKRCRRCHRYGHYEEMCTWRRSDRECRFNWEHRRQELSFRDDPERHERVVDSLSGLMENVGELLRTKEFAHFMEDL